MKKIKMHLTYLLVIPCAFLCGKEYAKSKEKKSRKAPHEKVRFGSNPKEVFSDIYQYAIWDQDKNGKGTSGYGSNPQNVQEYIRFLDSFISSHPIKSVLDLGCGDFAISKQIDWKGKNYLGMDVVKSVIKRNKKKYESDNIRFLYGDILKGNLPKADLLICKDVLQHLTNDDIQKIIKSFKNYKYCLITNDVMQFGNQHALNREIERAHRPIDLSKPPFNLNVKSLLSFECLSEIKQVVLIEN